MHTTSLGMEHRKKNVFAANSTYFLIDFAKLRALTLELVE